MSSGNLYLALDSLLLEDSLTKLTSKTGLENENSEFKSALLCSKKKVVLCCILLLMEGFGRYKQDKLDNHCVIVIYKVQKKSIMILLG